jgi:acetylglutamate kinase
VSSAELPPASPMADLTKPGASAPMAPAAADVNTTEVLIEALPYIRQFFGTTVVVKYGGNAMTDPALAESFAADIVLLHSVGIRVVVVHGGGPQIGDLMARLGKESEFRDGLRVTDAETLDIARMVLVGKVNRDIVALINTHGPLAVGLSGEDAGLIEADLRDPALGFVGDVKNVNPAIVQSLLAQDLIPVVSTIGADLAGQAYNINADAVAGALAGALGAEKVIYLTDIAGLLRDVGDPSSLIPATDTAEIARLIATGVLSGGMIPKIEACLDALSAGVPSAHLLDGRVPHVVLLELFTRAGVGTMITTSSEELS